MHDDELINHPAIRLAVEAYQAAAVEPVHT